MADADVTITLRANDEASKVLRGSFTELASKIGLARMAAETFAHVLKQAFEIGMQGAVFAQTQRSFDRLIKQLDVAPDLLDQMRASTRGTVDDLTLMSSTMTLAAGVSDDMAKQMMEVAPQILNIANAANALNPKLGTTEFLYQSLMTGIKRGSPMLIDNTGLTLRLGEANAAYAQSLGKSVDELTAMETKQALINAVLDAGDNLLRQIGGTTESASDSFERLNTSMKNWSDQAAASSVPALSRVADGLNNVIDASITRQRTFDALREAQRSGLITEQEYTRLYREATTVFGDFAGVYEEILKMQRERQIELDREAEKVNNLNESMWTNQEALQLSKEAAKKYAEEHDRNLRPALEETTEAQDELTKAAREWVDEIDTNLTNALESAMTAIDTFILGGWELQLEYERVMEMLRNDTITPEQAREKFEEIYVQAAIIEGLTGGLTFEQISENIASALNIPLSEAAGLAGELYGYLQLIDGSTVGINIQWNNANAPLPGSKYIPPGGVGGGKNTYMQQAGGPVWGGRPILVGEAGPEMFTPTANGYITNNTTTFNMNLTTQATQSSVIADYNLMRAMAGA